jgi:hypothetical protein
MRTGNSRNTEINRLEVRGSETNVRFTRRWGNGGRLEEMKKGAEDGQRPSERQPVPASPVSVRTRQNTTALREIRRRNLLFSTQGQSLCFWLYHKHRHISFTVVYFSLYKENFFLKINIHSLFTACPFESHNSRAAVWLQYTYTSQSPSNDTVHWWKFQLRIFYIDTFLISRLGYRINQHILGLFQFLKALHCLFQVGWNLSFTTMTSFGKKSYAFKKSVVKSPGIKE